MKQIEVDKRCLNVGLRFCEEQETYMVDDIIGVSANLVASLEHYTGNIKDEFNRLQDSAFKVFTTDLMLMMNKRKKFNTIIARDKPYNGSRCKKLLSNEGLVGYDYILPFNQFVDFKLKTIELHAQQGGTVEVFIINLIESEVVSKKVVKVHKGRNSIAINETYQNVSHCFIGLNIIDAVLLEVQCDEITDCCGCNYDLHCITGAKHLKLEDAYTCTNLCCTQHKWFCLNSEIRCNFNRFVCTNAEFFLEAYNYCVGIHVLEKKLNSYERGWVNDANIEIVKTITLPELKDDYFRRLNLAISQIELDYPCWECDMIGGEYIYQSSLV